MQNAESKNQKRLRFILHFAFPILRLSVPPTLGTICLV